MIKKVLINFNLSSVGCLTIEKHFICALKCHIQGPNLKIASYGIEYLTDNPSSSEISQKVTALLKRCGISNQNIRTIAPLEKVLIKEIKLPPMEHKLVEQALSFEIENHIPFNKDDIVYDFSLLKEMNPHHLHILLGLTKKESLQKHRAQLKSWGLKKPLVSLKVCAISAYYIYHSETFQTETVLLIDLSNPNEIHINILDKGLLRFSKSLTGHPNFSSIHEHQGPSAEWDIIFDEMESAITYFQTIQSGSRPSFLKIHSIKDIPDLILEYLCKNLQMQNVSVEHTIEREYILAFGHAISILKQYPYLDLKSESQGPLSFQKYQPHVSALLGGIFLCQLGLTFKPHQLVSLLKPLKQRISEIRQGAQKTKSLQKKLKKELKSIHKITSSFKKQPFLLSLLSNLNRHLPAHTYLTHLSKDVTGKITLEGLTQSVADVSQGLDLCYNIKSLQISKLSQIKQEYPDHIGFQAKFYFSYLQGEARGQK